MRHRFPLRCEALEGRKLLAQVAAATTPLVLTGSLAVDEKDATWATNNDSSQTTATPVSGRLGALGKVTGTWYASTDSYGDYVGPDTLQLHSAREKGTIFVEFNDQDPGKPQPAGHGQGFYQHAQKLSAGSGAFARDAENGSIEVFVNSRKTVVSLELLSVNG